MRKFRTSIEDVGSIKPSGTLGTLLERPEYRKYKPLFPGARCVDCDAKISTRNTLKEAFPWCHPCERDARLRRIGLKREARVPSHLAKLLREDDLVVFIGLTLAERRDLAMQSRSGSDSITVQLRRTHASIYQALQESRPPPSEEFFSE